MEVIHRLIERETVAIDYYVGWMALADACIEYLVTSASVTLCACLCVCVCVHAIKEKRLELSTPNLVVSHKLHGTCLACIDPGIKR